MHLQIWYWAINVSSDTKIGDGELCDLLCNLVTIRPLPTMVMFSSDERIFDRVRRIINIHINYSHFIVLVIDFIYNEYYTFSVMCMCVCGYVCMFVCVCVCVCVKNLIYDKFKLGLLIIVMHTLKQKKAPSLLWWTIIIYWGGYEHFFFHFVYTDVTYFRVIWVFVLLMWNHCSYTDIFGFLQLCFWWTLTHQTSVFDLP